MEFLVQSSSRHAAQLTELQPGKATTIQLTISEYIVSKINGLNPELKLRSEIMSEHGFLKPNPVLFDLERLKPRAQLGHEVGLGGEMRL